MLVCSLVHAYSVRDSFFISDWGLASIWSHLLLLAGLSDISLPPVCRRQLDLSVGNILAHLPILDMGFDYSLNFTYLSRRKYLPLHPRRSVDVRTFYDLPLRLFRNDL